MVARNCLWIQEALVVKSLLEDAGIEVFIADEHLLAAAPPYGIAIGGARVMVRVDDLTDARAILETMEAAHRNAEPFDEEED